MTIDLHSHSTCSDGTLSPDELVVLAKNTGIATFALTDHDTLNGYALALQTANRVGIRLVCGVEISASHTIVGGYGVNQRADKIIHIVGLDIQDPAKMHDSLTHIQNERALRGQKIVEKLAKIFTDIGFETLWVLCLKKAGNNSQSLGRAHIAQVLYELGLVKTIQDAFDKYLADNKPAYVAIQTLTMGQAIQLIHDCGGISVLAHPTRYNLSATRVRKLIGDFKALGGMACELPSDSEPVSTRQMIDRQIAQHNLLVSVGSDFHGSTMPWRKIGQVPTPKATQVGVWQKFVS